MIMLMNSEGEIFIDTKEINHNLEDFEKVKEEIKEINQQVHIIYQQKDILKKMDLTPQLLIV